MLSASTYRQLAIGLLALTIWGCAPDEDQPRAPYHYGQVSILNRTRQLQTITVTLPRYDLEINCAHARQNPAWYFKDLFDPDTSQTIELFSGQEIPVHPNKWFDAAYDYYGDYGYYNNFYGNDQPCHVVKIESPNFQPIVAFWSSDFPQKTFYRDANIPEDIPSDIHTIEMLADYSEVPKTETIPPWRHKPCDGILPIECSQAERVQAAVVPKKTRFKWGSGDTIRLFEYLTPVEPYPSPRCTINLMMDFQLYPISNDYGKVIGKQRTTTTPPFTYPCYTLVTTTNVLQMCLPNALWRNFEDTQDETWVRVSDRQGFNSQHKNITFDIRYIGNDGQLTRNVSLKLAKVQRPDDQIQDEFLLQEACTSTAFECQASAASALVNLLVDGTYYRLERDKWISTPTGRVYFNSAYVPIARTCGDGNPYYDYAVLNRVE